MKFMTISFRIAPKKLVNAKNILYNKLWLIGDQVRNIHYAGQSCEKHGGNDYSFLNVFTSNLRPLLKKIHVWFNFL